MTTTYKDPSQLDSAVTTLETLYTVPGSTVAIVSKLVGCNRSSSQDTIRVAVRTAGDAIDNKHYNYYDTVLPGNETLECLAGATLGAATKVDVYSTTGNTSWSLYKVEIS